MFFIIFGTSKFNTNLVPKKQCELISYQIRKFSNSNHSLSSYDPKVKSFLNWLGITYLLIRDEVFTTLRFIAGVAHADSTIVFD
jgi:hypothetical protein